MIPAPRRRFGQSSTGHTPLRKRKQFGSSLSASFFRLIQYKIDALPCESAVVRYIPRAAAVIPSFRPISSGPSPKKKSAARNNQAGQGHTLDRRKRRRRASYVTKLTDEMRDELW